MSNAETTVENVITENSFDSINTDAPASTAEVEDTIGNIDFESASRRLVEGTVTLTVQCGLPGTSRKVDVNSIYSGDAEVKLLRAGKKILESPELEAVRKCDTKFKKTLRDRNLILPSNLKGGFYRITKPNVPAVHKLRNEYLEERANLVNAAVESYNNRRVETMGKLSHLADESDYMSTEDFRDAFYAEIGYLSDNVPDFLESVSPELFSEAKENFAQAMRSNVEEITTALRLQFSEMLSHLSSRLSVQEDGTKPRLHEGTMQKFTSFLDDFKNLNITNDAELEILVNQAREVINGSSATEIKELRKDEALRNQMAEEFGKIIEETKKETFVSATRRRKFGFAE